MRILSVLALLGLTTLCVAEDRNVEKNLQLDGTYEIVSGERDGKAIPAERIKGSLVTFKGDKVYGTDKDKKEFFAASFSVDVSKTPHRIAMVNTTPKTGEKSVGVISVDGDTVRITYQLPGGEVPTEFKTHGQQHAFVLKKVK